MDLNPARSTSDCLPSVVHPPALDEAHADCTDVGQLVDGLKALADGLGQLGGKFSVVEDLQVATRRNFADGGRMPTIADIADWTLHKDTAITKAFSKHLASYVVQPYSFAYVPPGHLDGMVPLDVRQKTQTESLRARGIRESIDGQRRLGGVEHLAHTEVFLIVGYGTPEWGLCVGQFLTSAL